MPAPIVITLTAGNLGSAPCYPNEQSRFNAYIQALQATLPINFTTVIVSSSQPGPNDRNKIWVQVDGNNRIISINTFANGQWQTINPGAPYLITGEYRYYDPALYTPVAPWYPCDGSVTQGSPPVPNLSGSFLVCVGQRTLPSGSTDSATNFTNGMTGGFEQVAFTNANQLYPHAHPPLNTNATEVLSASLGGSELGGGGGLTVYDDATTGYAGGNSNAQGVIPSGTPASSPHPNLVPYVAKAIMQWRPDIV
jgi:hypothetical protein